MSHLKAVFFTENKPDTCGNYVVDELEECDAGFAVSLGIASDPCCDSSCRLQPGANCRWVNLAVTATVAKHFVFTFFDPLCMCFYVCMIHL